MAAGYPASMDKLRVCMDPSASNIHAAMQAVAQIRAQHAADPSLAHASAEIKRFQARRFAASYADLLQSPRYKAAAAFFLHELYGDQDYAERDHQFGRIASTISRIFPQPVVHTAAALAEVHALTEKLDHLMALQWAADQAATPHDSPIARYLRCWRRVADVAVRQQQLEVVLLLGQELNRLTRITGLRTLLRMMRRPATLAGLDSLQHFLETGFDAFAAMRGADAFLQVVAERESEWIRSLFEEPPVLGEARLTRLLAAAAA